MTEWPSQSAGLNPVKNLCQPLKIDVHRHFVQSEMDSADRHTTKDFLTEKKLEYIQYNFCFLPFTKLFPFSLQLPNVEKYKQIKWVFF